MAKEFDGPEEFATEIGELLARAKEAEAMVEVEERRAETAEAEVQRQISRRW